MSRPKLQPALLASLLLHAGLGLWIATRPVRPPPAPVSEPGELQWVEVEPAPAPAPSAPTAPPKRVRRPPAAELREVPKPSVGQEQGTAGGPAGDLPSPPEHLAADAPTGVFDGEPRESLFPRLDLAPRGTAAVPSGRGRTVRPDASSLSVEALRAEEEHRVHGRVQGWAEDTLAEARAQGGLPHPYLTGVGEAVRSSLEQEARTQKMHAALGHVVKQIGDRYVSSVESYGKSGNPNLGPAGINPRQSERLAERLRDNPDLLPVAALAMATETGEDLKSGKPLLSLTVELRQSREGTRTAVVLQPSQDPRFDAFVLEVWPRALAQAGPPPADAFRGAELRSVWTVEGWLRLPKKLEQALSYLPTPGVMGLGADTVLPKLMDEGYRYEFRARLLRAY